MKKNDRLELRLSEKDKAILEYRAEKCGVSLSEYVRMCCENTVPREKPPDEFWALLDKLYEAHDLLPYSEQKDFADTILRIHEVM